MGPTPTRSANRGADTLEYAMLAAIFCLGICIAAFLLRDQVAGIFNGINDNLKTVAGGGGDNGGGIEDVADCDIADPENGVAFAVYSEDDHSLDFYKRKGLPEVGSSFCGKTATAVYKGFESTKYDWTGSTKKWKDAEDNAPWFEVHDKVLSVRAVDRGISPQSMSCWFYRFSNLKEADLAKLDTSQLRSFSVVFLMCERIETIKVPGFTAMCTDFGDGFSYCPNLKKLEIGASDFSGANNFFHMFIHDTALEFDCSQWNVGTSVGHEDFNSSAPGVIPPKAWD